jgi:hypothetical protein
MSFGIIPFKAIMLVAAPADISYYIMYSITIPSPIILKKQAF